VEGGYCNNYWDRKVSNFCAQELALYRRYQHSHSSGYYLIVYFSAIQYFLSS
jgi:hypothetical protein